MNRQFFPQSFDRARWLSELSDTLAEANHMLATIVAAGGAAQFDADGLQLRILEIRGEIDLINRVRLDESRILGSAWPDEPAAAEV